MGIDNKYIEYIQKPFSGYCPFCLSGKTNWTDHRTLFKRIRYRCNACGAEVVVKLEDVLSGDYNSAKILIDNAGTYNNRYKFYELRRISFKEFYEKSIISHHYQRARRASRNEGFPPSCRLCKYGNNESDGESTKCEKFEFIGGSDWICDSYVDELEEITEMYFNAEYKNR